MIFGFINFQKRRCLGICLSVAALTACAHIDEQPAAAAVELGKQEAARQFGKEPKVTPSSARPERHHSVRKMSHQAKQIASESGRGGHPARAVSSVTPVVSSEKVAASVRQYETKVRQNPPVKDVEELDETERDELLKKTLPMIGQYGNLDSTGLGTHPRVEGEVYQSNRPLIYHIEYMEEE
ncbi:MULTISPECIES: hypothetical protein [unclassified Neisseria]|uniref:hypothetical protein n=1 Tax=unclassified Neisseria TaxID=2623750 RepID=UPI00266573B2|nr:MULTISPECIES: hypothetical protein [unclassified Neisseria]MDO1509424.1 hypothetical protein [Neisseria sp. MVDL19-042950]MDO1515803.1 hypothetical protein [Neisseria sp. MVDL18-041461]MDO1563373.1 hypothetical protein [Neisseria sp. MVDL20-010259]